MNRKTKRRQPRLPRTYSEAQIAGIKRSTEERRLATVERLRTAIEALKTKKQEISVQAIYDECGLRYAAIHHNLETLALSGSAEATSRPSRSSTETGGQDCGDGGQIGRVRTLSNLCGAGSARYAEQRARGKVDD